MKTLKINNKVKLYNMLGYSLMIISPILLIQGFKLGLFLTAVGFHFLLKSNIETFRRAKN